MHRRGLTPLERLTFGTLLASALLLPFVLHSLAAHLERATVHQCTTQAWPASQHAAHLAFCHANGYLPR